MTHHLPRSDRPSLITNPSPDAASHEDHELLHYHHHGGSTGHAGELSLTPIGSEPAPFSPPPEAPRPAKRKHGDDDEPASSSSMHLCDSNTFNQSILPTNEPASPSSSNRVNDGIPFNDRVPRLNEPALRTPMHLRDGLGDNSNGYMSQLRALEAQNRKRLAMERGAEEEFAKHAPEAASGRLFDKETPQKIEYQETLRETAGLGWWPPGDPVESSALCAECQTINFKEVFHPPLVKNKDGSWIQIYERDARKYRQTVRDPRGIDWPVNDSNCHLCRYLVAARRRRSEEPEAGKFFITFHEGWGVGTSRSFRLKHGFSNSLFEVYIKVCYPPLDESRSGADFRDASHTIICHINKPIRRTHHPQIISPALNVSLAISWLDACKRNHAECAIEDDIKMPKTRLIECNTRKLVVAGDGAIQKPRFVALSYVWGQGATVGQMSLTEDLPSNLPLTIVDAITVTKELGFQYLWIDQYCIDQSDDEDKKRQIQQMDRIYKCADLTIIAAAGSDCNYGLPGVSRRPRDVLDPFILDKHLTFGILPNGKDHWKGGSWHTRGWTFQEAHFASRRLVFSDTAMHLECVRCGEFQAETSGGVECASSDTLREHDSPQFCSERSRDSIDVEPVVGESTLSRPVEVYGSYSPVRHKSLEASILSYTGLVAQYTKRNLSFSADGLNAFGGVANALTQFDPPVYSIAGIPFVVHGEGEDSLTETTFSYGLAWWSSSDGFVPDANFPSWSWGNITAWSVTWSPHDEDNGTQSLATDAFNHPRGVRIEFNYDGEKKLVDLAGFAEACRGLTPLSRMNPSALCFKARILYSKVIRGVPSEREADCIWEYLGSGKNDLGRGYGGLVNIVVDVSIAPNDEQSDGTGSAGQVDDPQRRCLLEIDDQGLFKMVDSRKCSLILLRCNSTEAQVLVVEWQHERHALQGSARRVGIIEFGTEQPGKEKPAETFLSCFSMERDVRLI